MIVAIDGPAGSGKSSTARAVARELGFRHLDSGAFYRALTYAALRSDIPPERWDELTAADLDRLDIHAHPRNEGFRIHALGDDVTDCLRRPEVNAHVSRMARVPAVRAWLLEQLRAAARDADVVADGRDIGTVVFPDADLKIFLTADPTVRARRRLAEHGDRNPDPATLAEEVERLGLRDRMDTERAIAPLRRAPDAILVDTSALTFEAQVERIVGLVRSRRPAGGAADRG